MGKALKHVLPGAEHENRRTISFGRCTQSPYAENDLWFVSMVNSGEDAEAFIVTEQYARPSVIDQWQKDTRKWRAVAHKIFVGTWCIHYECLWKDVPVFQHQLPDGKMVKYGYCRTQSSRHPERELWYVAFRGGSTFVVDKISSEPNFMDRMGSDYLKWEIICWGR